jgi:hypothetical protein
MNNSGDMKLSEFLDIPINDEPKSSEVVNADIVPIKSIKRQKKEVIRQDFNEARQNVKNLIATGFDAIDGMMKVAEASDSPRAYEVVSILLKTMTDLNTSLLDLHDKANKAEPQSNKNIKNTTNNSIFVGSTRDLQNLINQSRSQLKSINTEEIENNDET